MFDASGTVTPVELVRLAAVLLKVYALALGIACVVSQAFLCRPAVTTATALWYYHRFLRDEEAMRAVGDDLQARVLYRGRSFHLRSSAFS